MKRCLGEAENVANGWLGEAQPVAGWQLVQRYTIWGSFCIHKTQQCTSDHVPNKTGLECEPRCLGENAGGGGKLPKSKSRQRVWEGVT